MLLSKEFQWEARGEVVQACKAEGSEPMQEMVRGSYVRSQ